MANEHSESGKVTYPVLQASQGPFVPGPDRQLRGGQPPDKLQKHNRYGFPSNCSQIHPNVITSSPGLWDVE